MADLKATMTMIWDQIDQANLEKDVDARRKGISAAIAELKRLRSEGYDDALYPLGYAYYCHPDRRLGSRESELAERHLNEAMTKGVEPDLSRLYLAYHLHDLGQAENSNRIVAQIDRHQLTEEMGIRCAELELCNHLLKCPESELSALLFEFSRFIDSLSTPALPPLLLMNTLEIMAKKERLSSCQKSLEQLDNAYSVMFDNWFSRLVPL